MMYIALTHYYKGVEMPLLGDLQGAQGDFFFLCELNNSWADPKMGGRPKDDGQTYP